MSQFIQTAKPEDAEEIFALLQRAYADLLPLNIHFTISQGTVEQVRATIQRETVLVLRKGDGRWQRSLCAFPGRRITMPLPICLLFTGLPWIPILKARVMAEKY